MAIYNHDKSTFHRVYQRVIDKMILTDQFCGITRRGPLYIHNHHNYALEILRTLSVKYAVITGKSRHDLKIKYSAKELKAKIDALTKGARR